MIDECCAISTNTFGKRVGWVENPGGDATMSWTQHDVDTPGNMEIGELIDLNNDGRLDFLPNTLVYADIDGNGDQELITGKRVYAHEVEPGDTDASVVFAYSFNRKSSAWEWNTIFHGDPAQNVPKDAKDRWALKDFPGNCWHWPANGRRRYR